MARRLDTNKLFRRSLIATAVAAALAGPAITYAQSADATLRGTAAPDSEITARNVATGAVRRTQADRRGTYVIPGLPPGTYTVDAGPDTEHTVTLTVASTATLDLTTSGESTSGERLSEIVVNSKKLYETRTSEVGETVSQQQINTVPQITRNFLEFADLVPGMIFTRDAQGNTSLTGGAQNASSVNVYIDGVGQKNYVKEGGVAGQFATQGNPFPQLAIGEYKVITSNYNAELDQVASAAVVAKTKSGTNEFHGEAFGDYTAQNFRAETPSERAAGFKTDSKDKEFGAALGGPIIQDMMHFFVTYEGKRYVTPITVDPGVTDINGIPIANLLPAGVAANFGPATLPFSEDLYFAKIDWEPSDSDRVEFSTQIRQETQTGGIGTAQAASSAIQTLNDDTRFDLRWAHSGNHWYNEVLLTHEDSFNSPSTVGLGNGIIYAVQSQNNQTVIDTGPASPLAAQNKGQRGPGIQDDLTFSDLHWYGDHTVKIGAKYKRIDLTAQDAENINPQFYYDVEATGTASTPYEAFFTKPVPGQNPEAKSTDDQFGIYLQDDWVMNEHLTWNIGLRWDYEKNSSYLDYVTPANVVAAFNSQDPNAPPGQTYAQSLGKGGVNINDYISNGSNRKPYTGEIQPRLGFSYDIEADQKHVVFGGYGRSYDRDLFDYLQLEQTKSALPEYTVYFSPPAGCHGTPCVPWNPVYLNGLSNLQSLVASTNAGAEVDMLNNNLKAPYSDQFSIGMRNKVGDWNTSVNVSRILSYDGFVFTLGNRYPNGAFFVNGGQPWGDPPPGFGNLIIGNNGIETRNTQVGISAEKPYTEESGWGTSIAYTYTDAFQNRDITQHYSFDEETIKQYPFIQSNAAPKHRLVTAGSVKAPWDFVIGGKLTLASPTPVDDIACYGATYPTGSGCTPTSATPKNFFGYRSLDLQVTKNFEIMHYATAYVRFDLLNVFDWANIVDTTNNWGANGVSNPNPVTYNYTGNITGVPRTLKLSIGAKF
jgi:outer membrane receptor protein involved in Fe transport